MSALKKTLILLSAICVSACMASCVTEDNFTDILADDDYVYEKEPVKEKEPAPEKTGETKAQIKALAKEALEKMKVITEYPAGFPTLDDVVAQYNKANMVVGWIINTEEIATDASDTYEAHGMAYQRVKPDCHYGAHELEHHKDALGETEKLIYNKETLEAYLATLIHPEEAKDYMIDLKEGYDVPRLISGNNGALYALTFTYSPSGYGEEETYELTKNNDGSYTFTVNYTVKGSDGEEKSYKHNFPYVKVDGRWVFENFIVIKQ